MALLMFFGRSSNLIMVMLPNPHVSLIPTLLHLYGTALLSRKVYLLYILPINLLKKVL